MQIITVDALENILHQAISHNIKLINEKASEFSHNKWQDVNEVYYALEEVDNPIARALIALRIMSYSYEASEILESQLVKMCGAIGERRKIHGARQHTMEKRESILATIASEAEKSLQTMLANNFNDENRIEDRKLFYLKEYKKLAESNMTLKDLKLDASSDMDSGRQNEQAIMTIIEQYKTIEAKNNG